MTRKEVAKLAGVSEATVSRVLNNVGPMREETRVRVMKAAAELGYEPNALAQQFARRRSGNIGVILPFVPKVHLFSTYYFSEILSGIGEAAQRLGYDLLLIFRDPEQSPDYAKLFRTQKVDACILLGSRDVPEERTALAEMKREGHPFCLVNQRFPEESFLSVDANHVAGSRMATRHLLDRGYTRIAFLNGPLHYSNSRDRLEGYAAELAAAGIRHADDWLLEGNYSRKSGYELAERVAEGIASRSVDAVFAANDRMAIGLMQGLKELGLEAGRDYAIVGYDDSDGSRLTSPGLTSVAVPFYEMGTMAAERVLEELADGGVRKAAEVEGIARDGHTYILPVSLKVRESS
ncbi:LacI family DNA-binding transcriptional regulator [Paenibacillus chungangensis]|uniref:LacI family DNA-binding transcriptional regulator n=1 Tax=Paenibacillus chungangensis TaxID=696535 RepID=A0ABW3HUF0_9BACL